MPLTPLQKLLAQKPMLCTLVDSPVDTAEWLYEPKLDGLRVLAAIHEGNIELISRNGKPQSFQFPDIVRHLKLRGAASALLDGEIVCLDGNGQSSFRALQQRFHLLSAEDVRARSKSFPAYLYVFDLLQRDGEDLTALPLSERKELLAKTVRFNGRIRLTPGTPKTGSKLLKQACAKGAEGIVGKLLASPYQPGRSDAWVKIKCSGRQEFVIAGFTDPQRSRVGLGALLVGYYDDGGDLHYAGKVGTGFDAKLLLSLRAKLDKLETPRNPFRDSAKPKVATAALHWVKPRLVAEIAFAEWTQNNLLRQPRFEGLRSDKKATAVRRERAVHVAHPALQARGQRASQRTPRPAEVDSLDEYARKRDFAKTPEPKPKPGRIRKGPPYSFVVHDHHATAHHFDLRLESNGLLKCWALTKEPPSDPTTKRLAIRTEDHPLAYAKFQGTIPEPEYGAGQMSIWDQGTFTVDPAGTDLTTALRAGKVRLRLQGKKLKGNYVLLHTHFGPPGKSWLFFKLPK